MFVNIFDNDAVFSNKVGEKVATHDRICYSDSS